MGLGEQAFSAGEVEVGPIEQDGLGSEDVAQGIAIVVTQAEGTAPAGGVGQSGGDVVVVAIESPCGQGEGESGGVRLRGQRGEGGVVVGGRGMGTGRPPSVGREGWLGGWG